MGNASNKRDANEAAIVKSLQTCGCTVQRLHGCGRGVPDLLVGRSGFNYLLEVKQPKGQLGPAQVAWHNEWAGHVTTVHTVDEALAAVGLAVLAKAFQ
jgi:hypothetical protein